MKKLVVFIVLISFNLYSQTIPTARVYDWKNSGLTEPLPIYTTTLNMVTLGADATGFIPADAIYLLAINQCTAASQSYSIYFPTGIYTFTNTISLNNNVKIEGDGVNTHLVFKTPNNCINLNGTINTATTYSITQNANRFDTYLISSANTSSVAINANDFLILKQRAATLVTNNWAYNSIGQFFKVKSILGDTLKVNHEMRLDYLMSDTISLFKINPIQNAGIKCLKITRSNMSIGQIPTIQFLYAYNCFIEGVEVDSCFFSHVTLESSGNCQVSGSYFHDAYDYGAGGRGYGVVMQFNSTDHKIENNIFDHQRHSVLCQAGVNGNVVDYNYSIEPFWTGVSLPSNSSGDIVLHGNYVYANLFEGNICQNIVIDDSHGQNGPYNTFFRNRANLYGIFMNTSTVNNNQTFVGNEITSTALYTGLYSLAGTGHFEYGNKNQGTITPTGTTTLPDVSYCYDLQPGFLTGFSWPTIGIPNVYNTGSIPAEIRNSSGSKILCNALTVSVNTLNKINEFNIYPNPTTNYINIKGTLTYNTTIEVFNALGKLVVKTDAKETVDVSNLNNGIYTLLIKDKTKQVFIQKIAIIK